MKIDITYDAMQTRVLLLAPIFGGAGDTSARFRVDNHAQGLFPATDAAVGMGRRTWSPPIT
ncbi:MAG TPA: hypothetical protein VFJ28_06840 [Marmoricola sp.]|nr:hypothetical protein [Marmoricola sp.]